jgi:truncated hemoglobin YjbI
VTPRQIALVETSLDHLDVDVLVTAFYDRAFAADPDLAEMFTAEPAVQRARFAAELTAGGRCSRRPRSAPRSWPER